MNHSVCKRCGKLIIWTETTKGKRMPVDVQPAFNGTISLEPRGLRDLPLAHVLGRDAPWPRYRTHFASCKPGGTESATEPEAER